MRYYCEEGREALEALESSENGLSDAEAQKRLEKNGKNRLREAKGKSIILRFLEQLADPMIIILIAVCLPLSRTKASPTLS